MKSLLKIAAGVVLVAGLAACSTNSSTNTTPAAAPTSTGTPVATHSKHHAKKCAAIKAQLRNMNRQAPGAQAQVQQLENQLEAMNCGVK